ncbi:MAG: aconitase X swivel domain-containing protein [Hyphomicrobiales bacterium]
MMRVRIKCKGILPGKAAGRAMVLPNPISFQGEIDEEGTIVVSGHPYAGESVSGRVMIYPEAKGSSGGCMMLRLLAKRGKKPAAIVNTRHLDANLVEGAILADIPMLCYPEENIYDRITTGDWVEVDGESGLILKLE